MLNFFYDSLETVKALKHPTQSDFINITISIFVVVIIGAALFVLLDTVFAGVFQQLYAMIRPV